MIDLEKFVDSLGPLTISKDDAAVAIAAICAQSRLDERERCAKIADAHKGGYAKKPNYKDIFRAASEDAKNSIRDEERGEDIAAEMIARKIRAIDAPKQD